MQIEEKKYTNKHTEVVAALPDFMVVNYYYIQHGKDLETLYGKNIK